MNEIQECRRCGRSLKGKKSIERGIGYKCLKKEQREEEEINHTIIWEGLEPDLKW